MFTFNIDAMLLFQMSCINGLYCFGNTMLLHSQLPLVVEVSPCLSRSLHSMSMIVYLFYRTSVSCCKKFIAKCIKRVGVQSKSPLLVNLPHKVICLFHLQLLHFRHIAQRAKVRKWI